jgi:hypothetical protein
MTAKVRTNTVANVYTFSWRHGGGGHKCAARTLVTFQTVSLSKIFSAALSLLTLEVVYAVVNPRQTSCKHIKTLCGDSTISKPY